jgi:hypothetical protein
MPFDDPDAAGLIDAVRQEYQVRYGNRDATLIDLAEFAPPRGLATPRFPVTACTGTIHATSVSKRIL